MSHLVTEWLAEHTLVASLLGLLSVALLAVTVLVTPWLIGHLPRDYFSAPREPIGSRGAYRLTLIIVRTALGLVLMTLGLIMMITPGPGVVALLLGLSLCEFPGKQVLMRRLAGRPRVFASLNWLRRRRGVPPFVHPGAP